MLEVKFRRIFPAVYFVNTNLQEKIIQVLLLEKGLCRLPDDSPNIFKRSNIDLYMERPSATFCHGKYRVLNDFGNSEFLVSYRLKNKSNKSCEYQPD